MLWSLIFSSVTLVWKAQFIDPCYGKLKPHSCSGGQQHCFLPTLVVEMIYKIPLSTHSCRASALIKPYTGVLRGIRTSVGRVFQLSTLLTTSLISRHGSEFGFEGCRKAKNRPNCHFMLLMDLMACLPLQRDASSRPLSQSVQKG